ncbi:hypothetical protein ACLOJK_011358 [Asimina triloba]
MFCTRTTPLSNMRMKPPRRVSTQKGISVTSNSFSSYLGRKVALEKRFLQKRRMALASRILSRSKQRLGYADE